MIANPEARLSQIGAYGRLMRFHRPIGIWLLLWPTLWSLWLAGNETPPIHWIILFTLGTIVMRAAGCVINDICDYRFDKHVARTNTRPLAAGELSLLQAWLAFAVLCATGFAFWWQLPNLAKLVGVIALGLSMLYPLFKRFFPCPQLVLGVAWYLGMIMAYATILGHIPLIAWLVYGAAVIWTLAFDTQCALSDLPDDTRLGLHSAARLFGRYAILMILLCQFSFLVIMIGIEYYYHLAWPYDVGIFLSVVCFIYQYHLMKQKRYLEAFTHNQWVGLCIFIGVAASTMV